MTASCRVLLSVLAAVMALAGRAATAQQIVPEPNAALRVAGEEIEPAAGKPPVMGRYPMFELLVWSADSRWLLSSGAFHHLAAWSPRDGRMYRMLELENHPTAMSALAGSTKFAVGTNAGTVEIWDTLSWKMDRRIKVAESYSTNSVALSNDGKLLAICGASSDGRVMIRSTADGTLVHWLGELQSGLTSPAISPDGTRLAAVAQARRIQLWSLADGKLIHEVLRIPVGIMRSSLRFATDGKTIIVVEPGMVSFWNPDEEHPVKVVLAPESIAPHPPDPKGKAVALDYFEANSSGALFAGSTDLSPDTTQAASITKQGTVAVWSIETRQIVKVLPAPPGPIQHAQLIRSLRYSPDGRRLAAINPDGEVIFWEVP